MVCKRAHAMYDNSLWLRILLITHLMISKSVLDCNTLYVALYKLVTRAALLNPACAICGRRYSTVSHWYIDNANDSYILCTGHCFAVPYCYAHERLAGGLSSIAHAQNSRPVFTCPFQQSCLVVSRISAIRITLLEASLSPSPLLRGTDVIRRAADDVWGKMKGMADACCLLDSLYSSPWRAPTIRRRISERCS